MNPEIAALLSQLATLLQAESPKPVDPPGTINGHSIEADADGFATVPAWASIFAEEVALSGLTPKQAEKVSLKVPKRLNCLSVQQNCTFTGDAKFRSYMNLCRRKSVGGASSSFGGTPYSHAGIKFNIAQLPVSPIRDWSISPETQASRTYKIVGEEILECENGNGAWSGDWNPAQDVAYFNAMYRKKVRDEIAALSNNKPSGFGVR